MRNVSKSVQEIEHALKVGATVRILYRDAEGRKQVTPGGVFTGRHVSLHAVGQALIDAGDLALLEGRYWHLAGAVTIKITYPPVRAL